MKKALLIAAGFLCLQAADAQVYLTGTSYTQNFNTLGNGLPVGWEVDTAATATFKGYGATVFSTSPALWNNVSYGFKNFAAKAAYPNYAAGTAALQQADTNRALGVRQTGTTNQGIAFVLKIDNTTGLSNFNISLKLESLDSTSPRISTWRIDYGVGASPAVWTKVATQTGDSTTGNLTFSDSTLAGSFGSALDNNAGPVWIRIVSLNATTGSNNRASSAIDDVVLTWTGSAAGSPRPQVVSMTPVNGAINVATNSNLTITFNRNIDTGAGFIHVRNQTMGTTQDIASIPSNVSISGKTATISGVTLMQGSTYNVTFDSTAFDTASYKSFGLYDTTAWVFTTVMPIVTVTTINENFEAACANSSLPSGWQKFSITGAQQWNCNTTSGNASLQINGFASSMNNENEDWLTTPRIQPAATTTLLRFALWKRFAGPELQVLSSTNWDGVSSPTSASWTPLTISPAFAATDTAVWKDFAHTMLTPSGNFYIAFKYTSTISAAYQMRLDSVTLVQYSNGFRNAAHSSLPVTVLGQPTSDNISLAFITEKSGALQLSVTDLSGRVMVQYSVTVGSGAQRLSISGLSLPAGLYLVRLGNGEVFGVTKALVR